MFSIFNKKKKVVVDCFTDDRIAYELVPITKASYNFPEWWKNLPDVSKIKDIDDATKRIGINAPPNNMKRCWGFTELYKRGVMIRNWCDLMIEADSNHDSFKYVYSIGKSPAPHPSSQYNNGFKNSFHIKLESPWLFKEKEGIPFLMIGAFWNNDDRDFDVCPGIMQFNLSSSTNINLFFSKKDKKYNFTIELGRPLAQLIPLRDDLDIEYKCHIINSEEYNKLNIIHKASFNGIYSVNKFLKKEKSKGKCPF